MKNNFLKKLGDKMPDGPLTAFSYILIGLALFAFLWPLIKLFFCAVINVRCIDDESGELITIPWAVIGLLLGIAALLIIIDFVYEKIKYRR